MTTALAPGHTSLESPRSARYGVSAQGVEVAVGVNDAVEADFCEFVRSRTQALLRTGFLLTGDRHLAEDLVQDALARTHRALRRLADDGHFEAYTRTAM